MIRPGFLDRELRSDLIELARDGSAEHRLARRANALVLLGDGMSCAWITETLPRTTRDVGSWIALECKIEYQTRSDLTRCRTGWAWNIANRKQSLASWIR